MHAGAALPPRMPHLSYSSETYERVGTSGRLAARRMAQTSSPIPSAGSAMKARGEQA